MKYFKFWTENHMGWFWPRNLGECEWSATLYSVNLRKY